MSNNEGINFFKSLVYNTKFMGPTLYNPKTSMISWFITAGGQKLNIYLAKSLNPNSTGFIQKGEKQYNHDLPASFTLSIDECYQLFDAIPKLLNGTYVDKNNTNEKYNKNFSLQHFPKLSDGSKASSMFVVESLKDKNGNVIPSLKISIIPSKNIPKTQPVFYNLRLQETKRFCYFLETFCKNADFLSCSLISIQKTIKQGIYSAENYKGKSSSSGGNYNNDYNYNDPSYEDNSPPADPPPPTGNDMSQPPDSNPSDDLSYPNIFGDDNSILPF